MPRFQNFEESRRENDRFTYMRFEDQGFLDRYGLWPRRIRNWTGQMCARARCIWIFAGTDRAVVVKRRPSRDYR